MKISPKIVALILGVVVAIAGAITAPSEDLITTITTAVSVATDDDKAIETCAKLLSAEASATDPVPVPAAAIDPALNP